MTQRNTVLNIDMITDDDCGIYRIGEIDTLPDEAIRNHVKRFGEFGYEEWKRFGINCICVAEAEIRKLRESQHQADCIPGESNGK